MFSFYTSQMPIRKKKKKSNDALNMASMKIIYLFIFCYIRLWECGIASMSLKRRGLRGACREILLLHDAFITTALDLLCKYQERTFNSVCFTSPGIKPVGRTDVDI